MPSRVRFFLFGVLLALSGCASASETAPTPTPAWVAFPAELVGTWDWESSSGGIGGTLQTPSSTGKTREFRCTVQSVCEWTTDGTVDLRQAIRLTLEQTIFASSPVLVLWLGEPPVRSIFAIVTLNREQLVIRETCVDCWTHVYRRRSQ